MPAKFLGNYGVGTPTTTPPASNTGGIPHLRPIARRDGSHASGLDANGLDVNDHGKGKPGRMARALSVSRETIMHLG